MALPRAALMSGSTTQPLIHADLLALDPDVLGWQLREPKPGERFLAPVQLPPRAFRWGR